MCPCVASYSAPCPRVAVIVPAYGVAHLVGEALSSVQAQTLTDWECVVVDDGAPDDVASAVRPFLYDSRIRFFATPNRGVSAARNTAIAATSAPLIALLDGDDLFRPDYLTRAVAVLESDDSLRLATCNARIFGAVRRERLTFDEKQGTGDGRLGTLADVLDRSFGVYIGTTFRRADFDTIGGFDTTMAQSEDFDFWVRLMLLGGHACYIDEVLGDYRIRAGSASSSAQRMLVGNLKVYEKACGALDGRPEQELAAELIEATRRRIGFEQAIDRVIDGDPRGGIAALRAYNELSGPVWKGAYALWALAPSLAKPMLMWRRFAHSRGNTGSVGAFLRSLRTPRQRPA